MVAVELSCSSTHPQEHPSLPILFNLNSDFSLSIKGGLFLDPRISESFSRLISSRIPANNAAGPVNSSSCVQKPILFRVFRRRRRAPAAVGGWFLSVSLNGGKLAGEAKVYAEQNGDKSSEKTTMSNIGNTVVEQGKKQKLRVQGGRAMNTTKHLWAGAIAAMVSR